MRAVIFDLDGVLVDSEPVQARASRELFAGYGREYTRVHEREFLGVRVKDEMAILKRRWRLKPTVAALMAQRRQILERLIDDMELKSGARALLQRLAKRRVPMGLGTSSETWYVDRVMLKFNLRHYFTAIVTGDDVVKGKPDPEVYLRVAAGLGVAPADCMVIEDAPTGAAAARAAGMKCVMVGQDVDSLVEVYERI